MTNLTLTPSSPPADSKTDPNVSIMVTPAPAAGQTLRFALTVTDNNGLTSQQAVVDVPIVALPVAIIAPPKAVAVGQPIVLDGSASTPKGQITSYKWQLVQAPAVPTPTPIPTPTPRPGPTPIG